MPPRSSKAVKSAWFGMVCPAVLYPAGCALLSAVLKEPVLLALPHAETDPAGAAALLAKLLIFPWLLFRFIREADGPGKKIAPTDAALCLAAGVGLGVLGGWLGKLLSFAVPAALSPWSAADLCFLGPICEELVFRGLVMKRGIKGLGKPAGTAAGVLLFSAAHGDWKRILAAIPAGAVFSAAMNRRDSVILPTVIHIAANTSALLVRTMLH